MVRPAAERYRESPMQVNALFDKHFFHLHKIKIKGKQAWASCAKLRLRSSLKLD